MTYEEARDAIYKVFLDVWGSDPVIWADMFGRVPDETVPWARVILRHGGGGQSSLASDVGRRRFSRYGVLLIQVFTPAGRGQTQGYQLATKVANAYEDSKLDVWFRNTRISEKGSSGNSDQIDVLTDFLYDEVR